LTRAVYGPSGLGLCLWQIINPQNGEEQVHKGLYTHQKGKTASHRLWLRRVPRGMGGRHHLTRDMYRPSGLRLCLFQIINPQTGEKQVHRVLYTHQKAKNTQQTVTQTQMPYQQRAGINVLPADYASLLIIAIENQRALSPAERLEANTLMSCHPRARQFVTIRPEDGVPRPWCLRLGE
jgi:hypothetical protein